MNKNFNIQQLQGRLVREPELKSTATGKLVATFDLAYNGRHRTDATGSFASFIKVEAWEQLAEYVARHCRKGMEVIVKGDLVQQRWLAPDGSRRSSFKIIARAVEISDLKNRPEGILTEEPRVA